MFKRLYYICLKAGHIAKTCRSIFYYFKCKRWHHACVCTFKNAGVNQNSQNSSGNGFTQLDKQNDDNRKTTVVSQNIVSVHPSLNLYHVSSVLLLTGRSHVLSCDTKNAKNLQILFDSGSQITFISKKACNQFNLNTTQKQPPKVLCKKRCSLKFRKTHRKTPGQSQSLFFQ